MSEKAKYLGQANLSLSGRNIGPMSRREALCAAGAGVLWSMLGALSARATPARAQSLGSAVPTVDRLAVRVVTDSYFLAFAQNQKLAGIEVQRVRAQPRNEP